MVAMAALQVFVVKMFFTGGRKGESLFRGTAKIVNEGLMDYRIRVND
jgi:hypothetical protein